MQGIHSDLWTRAFKVHWLNKSNGFSFLLEDSGIFNGLMYITNIGQGFRFSNLPDRGTCVCGGRVSVCVHGRAHPAAPWTGIPQDGLDILHHLINSHKTSVRKPSLRGLRTLPMDTVRK